jgi:hypothetical protein
MSSTGAKYFSRGRKPWHTKTEKRLAGFLPFSKNRNKQQSKRI